MNIFLIFPKKCLRKLKTFNDCRSSKISPATATIELMSNTSVFRFFKFLKFSLKIILIAQLEASRIFKFGNFWAILTGRKLTFWLSWKLKPPTNKSFSLEITAFTVLIVVVDTLQVFCAPDEKKKLLYSQKIAFCWISDELLMWWSMKRRNSFLDEEIKKIRSKTDNQKFKEN